MIAVLITLGVIGGLIYSFNGKGTDSFQKEKSFDSAIIEEIEINNESWNIVLKHTESKRITITAEGKQKDKKSDPVTIENKGNKIVVNQLGEKEGLQGFSFGKSGTISISIPDNEIETITLSNSNGDIAMKNIATNTLVVSNDSGSETITGLSAEKGRFTSKDGELKLENSSFKELIVASKAGDSYITSVTSPKMKITSTDGEVSVKDAEEGESLFVETKSGDITVSYKTAPTSLQFTANSDSADITVGLDNKEIKNTEKSKEGRIGDASNKVKLLSTYGTIIIK